MIKLIAAVSKNGVIGKDNKLPFHYSSDLKHFKSLTLNSTIIMGRKTFESIGKPLPNRNNIVISSTSSSSSSSSSVETFSTLEEAIKKYPSCFLIGGASIYREGLNFADEIHLTITPDIITGDVVYFPWINPLYYSIQFDKILDEENKLYYCVYKKII